MAILQRNAELEEIVMLVVLMLCLRISRSHWKWQG